VLTATATALGTGNRLNADEKDGITGFFGW